MRFGEHLAISTIGSTFRVFVCYLDSDILIVLILCNIQNFSKLFSFSNK